MRNLQNDLRELIAVERSVSVYRGRMRLRLDSGQVELRFSSMHPSSVYKRLSNLVGTKIAVLFLAPDSTVCLIRSADQRGRAIRATNVEEEWR